MKPLHPTACDFMVYQGYKIDLKFVFPKREINFWIQHLTSSLINHLVTMDHNIFLKSLTCEFSHCIFHQTLIIHFLINNLLLSKFIQERHTGGGIRTNNNLFVPCDSVFGGFLRLFFHFHTVSTGYSQLFCKF